MNTLGELANPNRDLEQMNISGVLPDNALKMLSDMYTIRHCEELIADMVVKGDVKCPCHFAIGQEAVAVGIAQYLRTTDRGFGAHRSHSHYLACGGDVTKLFSEVLGKATGASKGMGGSMHLYAAEQGFAGSVPIVAGTVPLAVGAGLAAKMDGKGDIGIAYFGDGACEEGVVHESLNLAASMQIPVIFVVENNLYSSHLDINLRQPSDSVSRFAIAHSIESRVVDGNDITAVLAASAELTDLARIHQKPGFIEAVTYRWRGHVGPDENIDVGLRRSSEEVEAWKKLDPIMRLETAMLANSVTQSDIDICYENVRGMVQSAMNEAYDAPYPKESDLIDFVYSNAEQSL